MRRASDPPPPRTGHRLRSRGRRRRRALRWSIAFPHSRRMARRFSGSGYTMSAGPSPAPPPARRAAVTQDSPTATTKNATAMIAAGRAGSPVIAPTPSRLCAIGTVTGTGRVPASTGRPREHVRWRRAHGRVAVGRDRRAGHRLCEAIALAEQDEVRNPGVTSPERVAACAAAHHVVRLVVPGVLRPVFIARGAARLTGPRQALCRRGASRCASKSQ